MRKVEAKPPKFSERIAKLVDTTVSVFSPKRAYERQAWREANGIKALHEAARNDRPRTSWIGSSGSADAETIPYLAELRDKSRDLFQNDGPANAVETALLDNVIGTGIMPQLRIDYEACGMQPEAAQKLGREIERRFACWAKTSSSDGRLTFAEQQAQAMRQWVMNGDAIALPLMIDPTVKGEEHREYSLAIEMVEADRLDDPQGLNSDPRFKDLKTRGGVEVGERGQPLAYWISKGHPGDGQFSTYQAGKREFVRYPARGLGGRPNVLHIYTQKRPGQTRGIPLLTPVLNDIKDFKDYRETERIAAKVAACFTVFITKGGDPTVAARNKATGADPGDGNREQEIGPGRIDYLRPGETISTAMPGRPNTAYDAYCESEQSLIGSAIGLPFELISRNFRKTTYLSARAMLIEARRTFRRDRGSFNSHFNQPILEMFVEELYLRGLLPEMPDFYANRNALTQARWIAPGFGMVDPQKEIAAARDAVNGNFTTQQEAVAELNGGDWEEVAEQRALEKERMDELGITPPPPPGSAPEAAPGNTAAPKSTPQDTEPADEAARLQEQIA